MSLKQRILERLEDRRGNAVRNVALHQDPQAVHDSEIRAQAYACAISDVERFFEEEHLEWARLMADGLFPTPEAKTKAATALGLPVRYLFP